MLFVLIILFNFIIGSFLVILGVNLMSTGFEKVNTKLIEKILLIFTGKLSTAFITGILVTALLQSSTAVTVITVGFVNSGLMKLSQAIGIIYGANIGTTVTAQLMSFKITHLYWVAIIIGLILRFLAKNNTLKCASKSILGLGLMFGGLNILNLGVPYIKQSEAFYNLFKNYGENVFLGLLLGMTATMLVHSSSATVGLTIVLFNSGLINFDAAMALTLGDNIGTCITAQLASLGTSLAARRAAWAHTFYNIIGVVIVLLLFRPFSGLVQHLSELLGHNNTRLVANTHTVFNIMSAIMFLPLTKWYIIFIEKVVRR